ncbi:MAG TPA: serine/threonine-protein kinase, partial [Kofleriaceae bacterium]|nr:serine/threonine-protein kinase [Kofleriaceae bacterium]
MRERVDEPVEVPVDELKGLRPPVDRVRMEATRARAEQSLFGAAAPARLGRYVLLGQSADGGMGIVHAAYDPELHRKVALKVLHPRRQADSRAQDRMIAEARALARLDHPNVVKVHDVITDDDQVVIIMEWIDGATLAAWERDRPRSWREIVTVYAQAGQGLAAAHGVGVVHRDFKPGNAIIGHDGRVRVLDFGLARSSGPAAGRALPAALLPGGIDHEETWSTSLTGTGDVVGTLAYAAPEQIAGRGVTAASDQFSFGVALHRALEGVPPFAGADAAALSRSIAAQRIACATDARAVPAWLRAIIARALAADPAARFPSLAALLAELTRPRGLRRWRVPLVVGASLAVAALALAMRPGASEPLASCDGGIAEAAAVWSAGPRVRVRAALAAIATPYVRQIEDRVVRGLDGYRDRWVALHRDACVAHRRGEQSEALLDRRMLCLQRHLGDLRATVSVLAQLDATSAANATDLVARMPDLAECADAERLQADTAPPASLTQRLAVDAARREISHAAALDRAGRSAEAIAAATAATGIAEQSGYPPVVADAVLTHGRILLATEDYERAAASFRRARAIALAQRELSVAVEAAARALYAEGMANADARAAERDAAVLVPLAEGLIGDHVARPLLLNNLGAVYMAAGDRG